MLLTFCLLFITSCSPILTYQAIKEETLDLKSKLFRRDTCKTHSYIKSDIKEFINDRFLRKSPARLGVIPFSVPVSFSTQNINLPGIDLKIASKVKAQLHEYEIAPIIELYNRIAWPGKKDEFFAGNHGAISFARQAGYDLILVGYIDAGKKIGELRAETKVIAVDSGITLYYGSADVDVSKKQHYQSTGEVFGSRRRPDLIMHRPLIDKLAMCIAKDIAKEEN